MRASRATLVEGLEYAIVEGKVVFLCRKTGEYVGGNDLATEIFELLLEDPSVGRLSDLLKDRYDVDPEVLKSDIDELLARMAEAGFVELEEVAE